MDGPEFAAILARAVAQGSKTKFLNSTGMHQIIVVVVVVVVVVVLQFVVVVAVSVVVVVVVVHALTRITKSVVAGQAPGTLELRNSPGKKHKQPKNGTRIYNS